MDINCENIKHLMSLSNFAVSDAEAEKLGGDLQNIIKYISQLDELDTDNVEPTYQVFEMENVWRADELTTPETTREELLAMTKEQKDNQIKVPRVL